MRSILGKTAIILGVLAIGAAFAGAADTAAEERLHEQLRDIEIAANEIENRAAELERYPLQQAMGDVWRDHRYEVGRIANRLDDIGTMIPKLQQNEAAEPWQKEIIDDISGLMEAMATQTEEAIDYLDENRAAPELVNEPYNARIASIQRFAEHIDELVEHVDERVDLPTIGN